MLKTLKITLIVIAVLGVLLAYPVWKIYGEIQRASSEDPLVWENQIQAFEAKKTVEPKNAVVFTGSSSIRLWNTLEEDMAPIAVIQRGFGGAKLNDVTYYAQRLVTQYEPRAVVLFAGTNDIDPGAAKSPQTLLESYQQFVAKVRQDLADVPIYYIAITPSIARWEVWPVAKITNQLIKDWSADQQNLYVIETGDALLGANGEPDPENYRWDNLHLSGNGYAIWTKIVRQRLLADFPRWGND